VEENNAKNMLIVGLGNPGRQYAKTRHNIGYMVVEDFAAKIGATFKEEKRFLGKMAKGVVGDVTVRMLLPETYMNRSGMAVRKTADFFGINAADILVVADDVAIDFGMARIRPKGGAGGHNGLKDITLHLGTTKYCRLRIGIGDREHGDLSGHVLSGFNKEEKERLDDIVVDGADIVRRWCREDIITIMNDVNVKQKSSTENEENKEQEETPKE